jgi:hypothetical protein
VLDYIFKDGAPVERVERYALDFVSDMAQQLGLVEQWNDLCGRREKTPDQCHCDEHA